MARFDDVGKADVAFIKVMYDITSRGVWGPSNSPCKKEIDKKEEDRINSASLFLGVRYGPFMKETDSSIGVSIGPSSVGMQALTNCSLRN